MVVQKQNRPVMIFQAQHTSEDEVTVTSRDLQMLYQDQDGSGNGWECRNMDIVDACRGTSVSDVYRGNFEVYDGPCQGNFIEALPIYRSTDRPNQPLYIYPIDYYPDNWSFEPLRGLVRWRIASFQNFDDKTSCRIETSNIFQIEFAADGHPYDYYPTIYCFDADSGEASGYQTSNINIRCNDIAPVGPGSGGASSLPGSTSSTTSQSENNDVEREHTGVIIAVLGVLMIVFVAGIFLWNRYKEHRGPSSSHPRVTETGILRCTTKSPPHQKLPGDEFSESTHSRFEDEPDQEQPSLASSHEPSHERASTLFTVQNLRSQLHESGHALRQEVRELWSSLHSR
jgi:hypothetical protein